MIPHRHLLSRLSCGFGMAAFAVPAQGRGLVSMSRPKAKSITFCFISGEFSYVDSLDLKQELARRAGQPMPMAVQRTKSNLNGTDVRGHALKPILA